MKQLTLTEPRRLDWLDVEEPRVRCETDAIVRPVAVAVCDFDRAVISGRYSALKHPIAVGHEIVAEVVETGSLVHAIKPGQKVVLPLHVSCGTCPSCRAARTNSCNSRPPLSNFGLGPRGGDWGGGMSDLLRVPYANHMAVPLPDGIAPVDAAAMGCNLVDLYRTMAPHLEKFDDPTVLILSGLAPNMALYGIVIAKALGVSWIDFLDADSDRLEMAEALGARPIHVDQAAPGLLHPIVVDCSGDEERLRQGLMMLAPDGVCTSVWPAVGNFNLPIGAMFMRNAHYITGQPHALALLKPVMALMQKSGIGTTSIPTEVLDWDDAAAAFGLGERKRVFVRG